MNRLRFGGRLVGLGARVIVGDFDSDLTSVFALAGQVLPEVVLAAAWNDDVAQVNPGLPNQLGFLVVVEDGHLELVVVRRVVDDKADFLVPVDSCM